MYDMQLLIYSTRPAKARALKSTSSHGNVCVSHCVFKCRRRLGRRTRPRSNARCSARPAKTLWRTRFKVFVIIYKRHAKQISTWLPSLAKRPNQNRTTYSTMNILSLSLTTFLLYLEHGSRDAIRRNKHFCCYSYAFTCLLLLLSSWSPSSLPKSYTTKPHA